MFYIIIVMLKRGSGVVWRVNVNTLNFVCKVRFGVP